MATRVLTASSDDTKKPFEENQSQSSINELDTTNSVKNTSYEVRPDVLPINSLDDIEPELGRIVMVDKVMYYHDGDIWKPFSDDSSVGGFANDITYFYTQDNLDPKSSTNVKEGLDRIITKVDGGEF